MPTNWLQAHGWWLATLSVVLGVLALTASVLFLLWLPADYFLQTRPAFESRRHPFVHVLLLVGKNVIGLIIALAGGIMSLPLVPGPGLLLLLIGLSLMNFPGKRQLELKILRTRWVLNPLNWLRAKGGKMPLQIPDHIKEE